MIGVKYFLTFLLDLMKDINWQKGNFTSQKISGVERNLLVSANRKAQRIKQQSLSKTIINTSCKSVKLLRF